MINQSDFIDFSKCARDFDYELMDFCFHCSALSSTELYQTRPMPVCTYEVLRGSISGPPVRFAQVGEQVYHKWSCPGGLFFHNAGNF